MGPTKKKKLLYMQLRQFILDEYQDKPYYSPLPGERELCDIYNVSRPTVRKALEILEEEGSIAKIPGKGAFFIGNNFNSKEPEQRISTNISFYNQVKLRGDYTSSKVLTQKIDFANEEVAKELGISEGDPVFHLERIRYINGKLWSISDAYVSYDLCPELLEHDFTDRSLYNTLSGYGHVPTRAERRLCVQNANEYDAFNLNLEANAPICVSRTKAMDSQNNPIEFNISRSDAYLLSVELSIQNRITSENTGDYAYANIL